MNRTRLHQNSNCDNNDNAYPFAGHWLLFDEFCPSEPINLSLMSKWVATIIHVGRLNNSSCNTNDHGNNVREMQTNGRNDTTQHYHHMQQPNVNVCTSRQCFLKVLVANASAPPLSMALTYNNSNNSNYNNGSDDKKDSDQTNASVRACTNGDILHYSWNEWRGASDVMLVGTNFINNSGNTKDNNNANINSAI